jgi:hypothetical protein
MDLLNGLTFNKLLHSLFQHGTTLSVVSDTLIHGELHLMVRNTIITSFCQMSMIREATLFL